MKSTKETTYILLDRYSEDVALWREINKVFSIIGKKGLKYLIKNYPVLVDLKQHLEKEIRDEDEQ